MTGASRVTQGVVEMYATELRLAIFLAFVGFVLFLVARQSRNRLEILRLHLEGRNRLIERFGDAEAFLAFARSEEGRAALRAPDTGDAGRAVPGLRLFQGAIVSTTSPAPDGPGWIRGGSGSARRARRRYHC